MADNTNDKKDVSQVGDSTREVNDSVSLVALGGGAPAVPPLLANCTSAIMMDQVLELHVASGYGLLQKFRNGEADAPQIQQHISSNNTIIPYLSHYASGKTKDLQQIDTESKLPPAQLT